MSDSEEKGLQNITCLTIINLIIFILIILFLFWLLIRNTGSSDQATVSVILTLAALVVVIVGRHRTLNYLEDFLNNRFSTIILSLFLIFLSVVLVTDFHIKSIDDVGLSGVDAVQTVSPTDTPTATHTPTTTPIRITPVLYNTPLPNSFASELMDTHLASLLGARIGSGAKILPDNAYQEFENGFMLFFSTFPRDKSIWVLQIDNIYKQYADEWQFGIDDPVSKILSPSKQGLYQPIHGFGKVWLDNLNVYRSMGWATICEISGDFLVQNFTNGMLLRISQFDHYSGDQANCIDTENYLGKTFAFFYRRVDGGDWIKLHD